MTSPRSDAIGLGRDLRTSPGDWVHALGAYLELTKPRVAFLVVVTMLCGALTAPGRAGFGRLGLALLGTALVVGAANALNMILERKSDALMQRTRSRPLVTGRLSPEAAWAFALILGGVGLGLLFAEVGALPALLTLTALVSYVLFYTPLKRITPLALWVGAVPGAIPPLIGWASVTGSISSLALVEFSILFLWQLPHFLAIAIFREEEYARAGLKVLPVVRGLRRAMIEIAICSLALVVTSLLPVALGLAGLGYAAIAIAAGLGFLSLATAGLGVRDTRRWARHVFFASMPYLVVVLGSLSLFARP